MTGRATTHIWNRKTDMVFVGTLKLVKRASRDLGVINKENQKTC